MGALGCLHSAECIDLFRAALLLCGAWMQLCIAPQFLHASLGYFLFWTSLLCGGFAVHVMSVSLEDSLLNVSQQKSVRSPFNLFVFCYCNYMLAWFFTKGVELISPQVGLMLDSLIDVMLTCGCGHLLLRIEGLMDIVLWVKFGTFR